MGLNNSSFHSKDILAADEPSFMRRCFEKFTSTGQKSSRSEPIVCFAEGTMIATSRGAIAVEALEVGDLVLTMDHGFQPIRWISGREVPGQGKLAPVVFKEGALGNGRDLRVSPQHRMLLQKWRALSRNIKEETLVPAIDLVNGDTIYRQPCEKISYYHFLFDTHEIIFAEGVAAESLHTGDLHLDALAADSLEELLRIFPELGENEQPRPMARKEQRSGFLWKRISNRLDA